MDEERIKEILKDPNTWDWDGCTYSDLEVKESWEDEFYAKLDEEVAKLRKQEEAV